LNVVPGAGANDIFSGVGAFGGRRTLFSDALRRLRTRRERVTAGSGQAGGNAGNEREGRGLRLLTAGMCLRWEVLAILANFRDVGT
jgi:hypothetical protein